MKKQLHLICFLIICGSKINAQNFQWVKTIGSGNNDQVTDIAFDDSGYVYVTGTFADTIDADPGPGILQVIAECTSFDGQDVYLQPGGFQIFFGKYTQGGQPVWVKQFGSYGYDYGDKIEIDKNGNILLSGNYNSQVDFEPDDSVNATGDFAGTSLFLARFSPEGQYLSDTRIEFISQETGYPFIYAIQNHGLKVNSENEIVLCGRVQGEFHIKGELIDTTFNTGLNTGYLIKLAENGDLDFADFFVQANPAAGIPLVSAVTLEYNGSITITGSYTDSLQIDPANPDLLLLKDTFINAGPKMYFAHFDIDGHFEWVKTLVSGRGVMAWDITTDNYGNHYITGEFSQPENPPNPETPIDFDPGTSSFLVPANSILTSSPTAFLASYKNNGDFRWAFWLQSPDYTTFQNGPVVGLKVAIDGAGRVYIGGITRTKIADLDPGPATVPLVPVTTGVNGVPNIFIARYSESGNYLSNTLFYGSAQLLLSMKTDSSESLYSAGYFNGMCRFNYPSSTTNISNDQDMFWTKHSRCIHRAHISQTICEGDSLLFNGYQLKAEGIYPRVISTANNCEEVEVLHLNILSSLELSQAISLCAGESYTIGNQTYFDSGIYSTHFTAANGCDSVVITALIIDTLTTGIAVTGNSLTAQDPEGDYIFQWLDCGNNYAEIPGENSSLFIALSNGTYSLEISSNSCVDTSECIAVSTVSVNRHTQSGFTVFPNPANDKLFLSSTEKLQPGIVRIYSTSGVLIFSESWNGISLEIPVTNYAEGLYLIQTLEGNFKILIRH